jgi:CHAT domain-containing protein
MVAFAEGTRAALRAAIEAGTPNGRRAAALRAIETAMDRVQEKLAQARHVADPVALLAALTDLLAAQRRNLGIVDGAGTAAAALHAASQDGTVPPALEALLDCVQDALAQAGRVADPAMLLPALSVMIAAQRQALGVSDGPATGEALAAVQGAYDSGMMPPEQRRLYERNMWTVTLWADLWRAHPGVTVAEPFSDDELRVRAAMDAMHPALMAAQAKMVPGAITPASLADLQAVMATYRNLLASAGPENKMRSYLCFAMAGAAFALGRGLQQVTRSREARGAFVEAARLYGEAGEHDDAASAEDQAAWIGFALNADVDRGVFADLKALVTEGIADPLERAQACGRLGRMAKAANDREGAKRYAAQVTAALTEAGFAPPEEGMSSWADAWVSAACQRRIGPGVVKLLQRVADLTLQALSVSHAQACLTDGAQARRVEAVMEAVHAVIRAALAEMAATEAAIVATLGAYNPGLDGAPMPPVNPGPAAAIALFGRVNALIAANQAELEPNEALIAEAAALVAAAQATNQPGLIASAGLEQAILLQRHGDLSGSDAAALAGETALAADPAQAGALTDPGLFATYLKLRHHRIGLAAGAGDSPTVLDLAQGAVRAIEARRDRIHDPFQQGAFLAERTDFYIMAAFSAFKLRRWEDLLVVMDLYRSRSALLNALAPPPEGPEVPGLQARLRQATAALEAAAPAQRPALLQQRREIWSLLSIARLRDAVGQSLPALSVAAVQAALAPDEAVVAWLWVTADIFLVLALDRTRVHAERVILTEGERTRLNRYVNNVHASTMPASTLGRTVALLTDALLPAATRAFINDARHLIFSPHRSLHLVPFHAARVAGQFLIERATVRYVPSFSSLLLPWTGNRTGGVLAVGVGSFGRTEVRDLQHAEEEAMAVAASWKAAGAGAGALLGHAATKAAFTALPFDKCRCLHLATHGTSVLGEAGGDPFLSRLYFCDGEVEALTIANLPLRAEIVVMSACCSGQRAQALPGLAELPGDDLFGLQGALFEAGAGTVIGALWPFDDETSAILFAPLHDALARNIAPEVALRDAVCRYLRAPGARDVFYWAPLFITSIGRTGPYKETMP